MYAHSRRQIVRVDLALLNPSQRHAPLAANTARNRQHGAPTRRGGAVDWLNPLPHSTHFGHTRGLHAYTSQRRYVGAVVGTKKATGPEGQSTMTAVGPGASVILFFTVAERKDRLQNGKAKGGEKCGTLKNSL